jgi:predicted HTH transcriptional regulator
MIDLVKNIKAFGVISNRENKLATRSGLTKTVRERQAKLLKLASDIPSKPAQLAKSLGVHVRTIYKEIDYLASRKKINIIRDAFAIYGMEVLTV